MDEQKCRTAKTEDLRQFCLNSNEGRGIWKVIDENRQLLEFIKQNEPDLLERYCWLEGWIARTDIFLNNMRILQNIPEEPFWGGGGFPRKWPGEYDISTCFVSSALKTRKWKNRKACRCFRIVYVRNDFRMKNKKDICTEQIDPIEKENSDRMEHIRNIIFIVVVGISLVFITKTIIAHTHTTIIDLLLRKYP